MRADRVRSWRGRGAAPGDPTSAGGASASTAWALVPPKPKELTPTTAGWSGAGKGSRAVCTWSFSPAKSIAGLGVRKCRLAGIWRCWMHRAALINPVIPAAVSPWPRFVLTEPTRQGWSPGRPSPRTVPRARSSIGSPWRVPVPWASTYWVAAGSRPERAKAWRTQAIWALRLGAAMPLLRPSELTAVPWIRATIGSPQRRASERVFSSTTPAPSERT